MSDCGCGLELTMSQTSPPRLVVTYSYAIHYCPTHEAAFRMEEELRASHAREMLLREHILRLTNQPTQSTNAAYDD